MEKVNIVEIANRMVGDIVSSTKEDVLQSKRHIHVKYGALEYGGSIDLLQSTLAILTGYEIPQEEIKEGIEMESEEEVEARVEKAKAVGMEAYQ